MKSRTGAQPCMLSTKNSNKGEKKIMKKLVIFLKENGLCILVIATLLFVGLNFNRYYIKTGSMEPTLPVGTLVFVKPDAEPEIGDVFAYQKGNMVVIHRVIGEDDDGYIFKGDANENADMATVLEEQLIGEVVFEVKFLAPLIKKLGFI